MRADRTVRGWVRVTTVALAVMTMLAGIAPVTGGSVVAKRRGSASLVQQASNPGQIAIPDGNQTFPSQIFIEGFETEVVDVDVTLHNLNHGRVNDLDILLLGPQGQTAVIFSDVGTSASALTVTLDDGAPAQVPSSGTLRNGTFQPTNFSTVDFWRSPLPQNTSSGSRLSVFNSTNPNGIWSLFIVDDDFVTTGTLTGGWSLRIETANGVPNAQPENFTVKAGKTLDDDTSVLQNDRDPDNDFLTAVLAGKPGKGSLQLRPDGTFTYKANKKAKGQDTFTYLAQDPGGLSDLETVTITITKARKKRRK